MNTNETQEPPASIIEIQEPPMNTNENQKPATPEEKAMAIIT